MNNNNNNNNNINSNISDSDNDFIGNNNNNNNNNNNDVNLNINSNSNNGNIDHSYDDVDFNNKDPLFFSSGNEYMYRADEDDDYEDEDGGEYLYGADDDEATYGGNGIGGSGIKNKKKKKKIEFLIDGFDENSESLVRSSGGKRFGYLEKGTKIIIFIGIIAITVTLFSIGLYYYAKDHHTPIVNYIHPNPVIVISFDGFRWDYLNRGITPNLQKLINDGSYRADNTSSQFPTKTFPNHYSIATGLHPEYHGIISNHMYDPTMKEIFDVGDPSTNTQEWYWGEPIWVTAEKHGVKSACYFFPGCNVKFDSHPLSYDKAPFKMSVTAETIFDTIYDWTLLDKSQKPFLTMAYVHEVDDKGHKFGPDSQEVNEQIKYLDDKIGDLVNKLKSSNQYNTTNLIILSDHGMASLSKDRIIYLDQITNDPLFYQTCFIRDTTPLLTIFPIDGKKTPDEIYESLHGKHTNLKVYKKEDIPKELYFNWEGNKRIPPVIGIADLGWTIMINQSYTSSIEKGNHGFYSTYDEMKGIFIGHGPNIKPSSSSSSSSSNNDNLNSNSNSNSNNDLTTDLKTFTNVEIYNFISKLLNIDYPAKNNGTTLLVDELYRK